MGDKKGRILEGFYGYGYEMKNPGIEIMYMGEGKLEKNAMKKQNRIFALPGSRFSKKKYWTMGR